MTHVLQVLFLSVFILQVVMRGELNDYCHKLNITESANCQCGERETVEHYILHCDQYEEAREKLIHDIFLLSGSMHLSLEVLLYSRSR